MQDAPGAAKATPGAISLPAPERRREQAPKPYFSSSTIS